MENILIVLFGLTMLYMAAKSRIDAHIRMLFFQGILLCLIALSMEQHRDFLSVAFLVFETLAVKALIIPLFLKKIIYKHRIYRDNEPQIPNFYSLVIASILLFGGFMFQNIFKTSLEGLNTFYFGVSMSVIIISLFLITVKHKVITMVIGFITMENGIFLLSLSAGKHMPFIVNLGILLDLFIAVFIFGLFISKISETFDDMDVATLSDLKDAGEND